MATTTEPAAPANWTDTDRRVRHPLQAVRGYIRSFVLLEGLGLSLLYILLAFWIGLFLDWGLFQAFAFDWVQELQELVESGNEYWLRLSLLVIAAAGLLGLVVRVTVARLFREFNDTSMALLLERRFPRELGDRLITAVELADPKLAAKYSYSLPMVQTTIREAAERVEKLPVRSVFNWARLRRIFLLDGALSLGLFLLVGLSVCTGDALFGGPFDPVGFGYRFSDSAVIWAERNILLRDSYWPRSSYVELIGFQDTPEHPGDMRVGRDEERPALQARAIEWVIADRHVRGGWRPMRFSDLHRFMDSGDLAAIDVPADWPGWIIDLDDVPGRVPGSVFPPDSWQAGLSSGTIASKMQHADAVKAAAKTHAKKTMDDLLDWHTWTVDRIALQMNKDSVRHALYASYPDAARALDKILGIRRPILWSELKWAIETKEIEDQAIYQASTLGLLLSPVGHSALAAQAPLLKAKSIFPGSTARELAKVKIIPDFGWWIMHLQDITRGPDDDLAFPPADWEGIRSGDVRKKLMEDSAMEEKNAAMAVPLSDQLDWRTWTVDRIAAQLESSDEELQNALLAFAESKTALLKLFGKKPAAGLKELPAIADDPSMSRHVRQLLVPETVRVRYRGASTKSDAECRLEPNNKFTIGLTKLKESVRFTVIANDYYTPYRKITLRPPPTLVKMSMDKDEPAYIYFRLQGDQSPLAGKRRPTRNQLISVTGSESTVKVPYGTDVILTAHVEPHRAIADVWIAAPERPPVAGSQVPDVPIAVSRVAVGPNSGNVVVCMIRKIAGSSVTVNKTESGDDQPRGDETLTAAEGVKVHMGRGEINDDRLSFVKDAEVPEGLKSDNFDKEVPARITLDGSGKIAEILVLRGGTGIEDRLTVKLPHLTRGQEFSLVFRDQDKVKGKHQVRIVVDADQPPELFDMDLEAVLRNPRFRSNAGSAVAGPSWASEAFLITPDALLPIKGSVKDDYGLTKVEWKFEVEQVEVELQGDMPSGPKADGGNRMLGRVALIASTLQAAPGQNGMAAVFGAAYAGWMPGLLSLDKETKVAPTEPERSLPLESFQARLQNHGGALTLEQLTARLTSKTAPRELYRKHSWKGARGVDRTDDADGFDVRRYLPKLKSPNIDRVAQFHYYLRINVSATDNNVETGPSTSRTKKPFQFLIVSQNELLAQMGLEEELLSERLGGVYDKLGIAKTILGEQLAKLGEADPKFAEIAIRVDQATRGISDGFGKTREVLTDFKRIEDELEINRVTGLKFLTVDNQIVKPLERIVDQSDDPKIRGDFPLVEDAVQKLQEEFGNDAQLAAKGGKLPAQTLGARKASLEQTQKKVVVLMDKLNDVLAVMQQEINNQKLIDQAREIERRQRQLAERWRALYLIEAERILKGVLDPSGK